MSLPTHESYSPLEWLNAIFRLEILQMCTYRVLHSLLWCQILLTFSSLILRQHHTIVLECGLLSLSEKLNLTKRTLSTKQTKCLNSLMKSNFLCVEGKRDERVNSFNLKEKKTFFPEWSPNKMFSRVEHYCESWRRLAFSGESFRFNNFNFLFSPANR